VVVVDQQLQEDLLLLVVMEVSVVEAVQLHNLVQQELVVEVLKILVAMEEQEVVLLEVVVELTQVVELVVELTVDLHMEVLLVEVE
jgi:hypothetical protein